MFDFKIEGPRVIRQETTIVEKRAPTDESLKLLKEFQDKALEGLLQSVLIQDNVVNGVAVEMQFNGFIPEHVAIARFKINGTPITIKTPTDRTKFTDKRDLVKYFVEELAGKIAEEITVKLWESLDTRKFGFSSTDSMREYTKEKGTNG